MRVRFSSSLQPPEPARALTVHLLRAAAEISVLPAWVERYPLGAMSASARQVAWAVGRHLTGNPDHGFAMAARVPPEAVGELLWTMYRAAPSLEVLHARYPEFSELVLDLMSARVELGERSVWLCFEPEPRIAIDRAEEDFRAAMQVATWRALHGTRELAPLAVHFTYARPASTQQHVERLGSATLRFAQPCFALELSRRWWSAPLPTRDPARFARAFAHVMAAVEAYRRASLSDHVEAVATELLSSDPTAPVVASALGLSERTLRRRLAQLGLSFRSLVDRTRRRERELLEEIEQLGGRLSARERARLLGFSSPGALRNALRRWSGRS